MENERRSAANKSRTQIRAEEIQSNLDPNFPSFVKLMLHSHVNTGFWLGLPLQFCISNLPRYDHFITLLDENEEMYETKFLVEKCGLSAGWRKFAITHQLVEGDALVFQLVDDATFQVYIVREYSLDEVDAADGLLKLDARVKTPNPAANKRSARKPRKFLSMITLHGNIGENISTSSMSLSGRYNIPGVQHLENDSEEVESEFMECEVISGAEVEFQDSMINLENFNITVNGLSIDSELSEAVRIKYYELCRSQNCLLHIHLPEHLDYKLVAGIISETVKIADAIRGSKLNTSRDEFSSWEKSLKAFKELGMNVGFMMSRLKQLVKLAYESEQATESKRYRESVIGKARAEEDIRTLEMDMAELKDKSKRFEKDIRSLKVKAEKHELTFQAKVNTPW